MAYRTACLLLKPTARQEQTLHRLLALQCELYNAALEERRGAWRWERRSVTRLEQHKELNGLEHELMAFGVTVARGTLLRLDRAFQGYFRRLRAGGNPGFPRFRSARRFDSVEYPYAHCWKILEARLGAGRLYLQGVGHLRYFGTKRGLPGTPKTLVVKREGRRWRAYMACETEAQRTMPATGRAIGLDLGVTTLVATSKGELVDNERFSKRSAEKLKGAQQVVERRQRGSKRRAKAGAAVGEIKRKEARQRRDAHHKLSRRLIEDFDLIVIEDLKVANMVRRPKPVPDGEGGFAPNGAAAKSGLNREISSASWAMLRQMLSYKAEEAGRTLLSVPAPYTSQRCHLCGNVSAENRKAEAFCCRSCGHQAHAGVNAAQNILGAGLALQALAA